MEENKNKYIKFDKQVDFLPIMGKDRKIFATYEKTYEDDEYDYYIDRIPEILDMDFYGITIDFEKLIFMCQEYPIEIILYDISNMSNIHVIMPIYSLIRVKDIIDVAPNV